MADKEKMVRVLVVCPPRPGYVGFGSAGKYFPNGDSEHVLPQSMVDAMLAEKERGESILAVRILDDAKVK